MFDFISDLEFFLDLFSIMKKNLMVSGHHLGNFVKINVLTENHEFGPKPELWHHFVFDSIPHPAMFSKNLRGSGHHLVVLNSAENHISQIFHTQVRNETYNHPI
jgi:hypothetical protein